MLKHAWYILFCMSITAAASKQKAEQSQSLSSLLFFSFLFSEQWVFSEDRYFFAAKAAKGVVACSAVTAIFDKGRRLRMATYHFEEEKKREIQEEFCVVVSNR